MSDHKRRRTRKTGSIYSVKGSPHLRIAYWDGKRRIVKVAESLTKEQAEEMLRDCISKARARIFPREFRYTYLVSDGVYVKIGRTNNVVRRVKSLQHASAIPLRLLVTLEGDREKELHQRYAHARQAGEWFLLQEMKISHGVKALENLMEE